MVNLGNPTFLGAIMDVLPICIDITGPNREKTGGIYNATLTYSILEGAWDQKGNTLARFIHATTVVPFPKAMQFAWQFTILICAHIHGLNLESTTKKWEKLGPQAEETLANVLNRGATERRRRGGQTTEATMGNNEDTGAQISTQDMAEAMAISIKELEVKGKQTGESDAVNGENATNGGTRTDQIFFELHEEIQQEKAMISNTVGANKGAETSTRRCTKEERRARSAKAAMALS
jgi:hypothetical protein